MQLPARRRRRARLAGVAPRLDAEPDQIGRADPAQNFEQHEAFLTTQLKPKAMAASKTALPRVVPTTVMSAARVPSRAPVAMTSVTIGPGVMTRTAVIRRKAANRSQFMSPPGPQRVRCEIHTGDANGAAASNRICRR